MELLRSARVARATAMLLCLGWYGYHPHTCGSGAEVEDAVNRRRAALPAALAALKAFAGSAALPAALPPCRAAPGTFLLYMHSAVIPHYHPRAAMAPLTESRRRGRGTVGSAVGKHEVRELDAC